MNGKQYLQKALSSMKGNSQAIQEARYHIRIAMGKIESSERKQEKVRITQAQEWNELLRSGMKNQLTPTQSFEAIEKLLDQEQNKLKELQNSKKVSKNEEIIID